MESSIQKFHFIDYRLPNPSGYNLIPKQIGKLVILVPYRREHVPVYFEWMQDEWIREMTASEQQTFEEECENQESWHVDEKKCTFIILDRSRADNPGTGHHGGGMAGDVNLFFHDDEDPGAAEINVMIADPSSRRKGLAKEALALMMDYAVKHLKATKFIAKVSDSNTASLNLFTSMFRFEQTGHSDYFKETTLERANNESLTALLDQMTAGSTIDANGYDKHTVHIDQ